MPQGLIVADIERVNASVKIRDAENFVYPVALARVWQRRVFFDIILYPSDLLSNRNNSLEWIVPVVYRLRFTARRKDLSTNWELDGQISEGLQKSCAGCRFRKDCNVPSRLVTDLWAHSRTLRKLIIELTYIHPQSGIHILFSHHETIFLRIFIPRTNLFSRKDRRVQRWIGLFVLAGKFDSWKVSKYGEQMENTEGILDRNIEKAWKTGVPP